MDIVHNTRKFNGDCFRYSDLFSSYRNMHHDSMHISYIRCRSTRNLNKVRSALGYDSFLIIRTVIKVLQMLLKCQFLRQRKKNSSDRFLLWTLLKCKTFPPTNQIGWKLFNDEELKLLFIVKSSATSNGNYCSLYFQIKSVKKLKAMAWLVYHVYWRELCSLDIVFFFFFFFFFCTFTRVTSFVTSCCLLSGTLSPNWKDGLTEIYLSF